MVDPESIKVSTPEEMLSLGGKLGRNLFGGAVIGLEGPMGAGKTTLVRGIANGMSIQDGYVVTSPTFTILQKYPCLDRDLYHLDLYRISGTNDLESTGYRETMGPDSVLVIEWVDREPSALSTQHLLVSMDYDNEGRGVVFKPRGRKYAELVSISLAAFGKPIDTSISEDIDTR